MNFKFLVIKLLLGNVVSQYQRSGEEEEIIHVDTKKPLATRRGTE